MVKSRFNVILTILKTKKRKPSLLRFVNKVCTDLTAAGFRLCEWQVSVLGLLVKGLATGWLSARSCQKLPLCLTPRWIQAKAISDSGSASGVRVKKGKKPAQLQLERGEKQPCRHQGQETMRWRRCSRCWSRDSLAACGEGPGEATVPMEDHNGAEFHLQPMEEPTLEEMDAGRKLCEAPTGAGLLAGCMTLH